MKNLMTVILRSGATIDFDYIEEQQPEYHSNNEFISDDGARYKFSGEEVAARIVKPYTHCQTCGADVMPEVNELYAGNKVVDRVRTCPKCGANIDD